MMQYITRCPACQQAFRLTEAQLTFKDGLVRCGFCQNVFNAKEDLYRSLENSSDESSQSEYPKEIEQKGIAEMVALAGQLKGFDAVDDDSVSSKSGLVGIRTEPRMGPVRQDIINGSTSSIEVIHHEPKRITSKTQELESELEQEESLTPSARSSKRWIWSLAALVAFLAICIQVAAMFRNDIVEKLPQAQPLFEQLCAVMVCQSPEKNKNSADLDQTTGVKLASQSLQKVGGNEYIVVANLTNESETEKGFPVMTVTLKGEKGDVVSRRQLSPNEYLHDASQKLLPKQTRQVAFTFKVSDGEPRQLVIQLGQAS